MDLCFWTTILGVECGWGWVRCLQILYEEYVSDSFTLKHGGARFSIASFKESHLLLLSRDASTPRGTWGHLGALGGTWGHF